MRRIITTTINTRITTRPPERERVFWDGTCATPRKEFRTTAEPAMEHRLNGARNEPPALQRAWFCLRARSKHEHIAARHLQQMTDVEVFLPRIRFRRKTRQGPAWVTEALFPNYLFARFDW